MIVFLVAEVYAPEGVDSFGAVDFRRVFGPFVFMVLIGAMVFFLISQLNFLVVVFKSLKAFICR